jgi:hypothetical protein
MARVTVRQGATLAASRTPFTTHGNLSGVAGSTWTGRLPSEWSRAYADAASAGRVTFTVLSYSTPIAWHDSLTGWTVPPVRYSVTTSKAQGYVRGALANADHAAYAERLRTGGQA